jgi:hypothetical protein
MTRVHGCGRRGNAGFVSTALLMGFVFLMAAAPPALAEDAAAEPERPWGFTFEPYLWVAGIGGKIGSDQIPSAVGVTTLDLLEHGREPWASFPLATGGSESSPTATT